MSTKIIDVLRYDKQGDLVDLLWEVNGLQYERQVFYAEIDTRDKVVAWLNEQFAAIPEPGVQVGRYTLTIDDLSGQITNVQRDTQVDDILVLIPQRQTQITIDTAALPAATNNDVKAIIGRQLSSENKILDVLAGILRFLKRIG